MRKRWEAALWLIFLGLSLHRPLADGTCNPGSTKLPGLAVCVTLTGHS
jgi:hypothetical protein